MRIILKRYYGDRTITKSELEVWMDGETEPRMVCDAREPKFFNYALSFPGASSYCLPAGTFKLKAGNTPYSPMGLRIPRCPGHRCVFIGHKWSRQYFEGEILIGQRENITFGNEEQNRDHSFIHNEEETFKQLDKLVYEAYAKGEDFILEIDNSQVNDCTINRN